MLTKTGSMYVLPSLTYELSGIYRIMLDKIFNNHLYRQNRFWMEMVVDQITSLHTLSTAHKIF